MAVVGLKTTLMIAKDADGKPLMDGAGIPGADAQGVLDVSVALQGASQANITGLDQNATVIYGNNAPVDVTYGNPTPQVALIYNNLPYEVQKYVLGYKKDENGVYYYTGVKPIIGLIVISQTVDKKNDVLFGFSKGIMSQEAQNIQTNEATEHRESDTINYTALGDLRWDGQAIKTGTTLDEEFKFDKFKQDVFNLADPKA